MHKKNNLLHIIGSSYKTEENCLIRHYIDNNQKFGGHIAPDSYDHMQVHMMLQNAQEKHSFAYHWQAAHTKKKKIA
jgi:hypothetical protein